MDKLSQGATLAQIGGPSRDGETPDADDGGRYYGHALDDWRDLDDDELAECCFALIDDGIPQIEIIEDLAERLATSHMRLLRMRHVHADLVRAAAEAIDGLRKNESTKGQEP